MHVVGDRTIKMRTHVWTTDMHTEDKYERVRRKAAIQKKLRSDIFCAVQDVGKYWSYLYTLYTSVWPRRYDRLMHG